MSKAKDKAKKDAKATKHIEPSAKQFLARVFVSLKPTVNDPEGITIGGALGSLGFDSVDKVRSGRYFQLTLRAAEKKEAAKLVDQMCARVLANPVIETYTYEVEEAKG